MDAPLETRAAARWTRSESFALEAALAAFMSGLAYATCRFACYPQSNDLDEVGWIAAHMTLGRPESLANQGYPPGLPLVLRLLSPLVGSFLRATFLWQAVAATASVFFVARITADLCRQRGAAALAVSFAALACLPVATSEFADGTSTAIFLSGVWALTHRGADRRAFFFFGLAAGAAYLFRTHYSILIVLVPASLWLSGMGLRATLSMVLPFCAGFAATAWPLLLLNTLAYGTPLHAGISQYNIAQSMLSDAFNWEDYPHTYNRWPLSRILRERLGDFLVHIFNVVMQIFGLKESLAAATLGVTSITLNPDRKHRQLLAFLAWFGLLYLLLVLAPTRYTDRAYAPIAMLAAILAASGLAELAHRASRPRWALAGAALAVLFLTLPLNVWQSLQSRHQARLWNERVVDALRSNGMHSSDEVFTNEWAFYPVSDPGFVTFYNYGGWIELDSEYARERPHPTAETVSEWQDFFAAHGIHFAVLRWRNDTREIFEHPPPEWKQIYADNIFTAWAIQPRMRGAADSVHSTL
jgi:hypothetical protein